MSTYNELKKNLFEVAATLNEKHGVNLSCKDIFAKEMYAQLAKFKAYADKPHTQPEYDFAVTPVKDAVKTVNSWIIFERLTELKSMKHQDAIRAYLASRTVKGFAVTPSKESVYDLKPDVDVKLDAYAVLDTVAPVEMDAIKDYCCVIADNIARKIGGKEAGITKRSLSPSYIELRKRLGWDMPTDKLSRNELAKELTEVVSKISNGLPLKMITADAVWLEHAIVQGNDSGKKGGGFVKREEETVIRAIFTTMYNRMYNLPYEWQDKTRYEKSCLSVKNNKEMAEAEEKPAVEAPAGPVTVTVPEETQE